MKQEYTGLTGNQIMELRKTITEQELTCEVREKLVGYSGDTFLDPAHMKDGSAGGNKHSLLEDVIAMVSGIKINHLILGHFSSRYDDEEITHTIKDLCSKYSLSCAVYAVLPGKICKNVLDNKVYAAPVV
ncbi:MAG TPA: hypothetical protein VGO58_06800 [Chitinophagaceae bacterium]|nr:hypothetical protein [Chitinophagaceae bacterium]